MLEMILADPQLQPTIAKVEQGQRLTPDDGLALLQSEDLLTLGYLANLVRERQNGRDTYYIVNHHINYTNVCRNRCRFCAFSRDEGEPGAYLLNVDQILDQAEQAVEEARAQCGVELSEFHIVGGLHPAAPFDYYLEMLSALQQQFPEIHLQAFTAVEIEHLARIGGISVRDCLLRLQEAGLGSLPGGGAEIFSPRIRQLLCPPKLSGDGWLSVMRTAHELGIHSNATMLYGHLETPEEIIDHLGRLRDLQDETGGFLAFIPLAYHPEHNRLGEEMAERDQPLRSTTGFQDLKTVAISRLMLDNFPHIKAFWIMLGLKMGQVALSFGADDLDGTVGQEKITHSAGAKTPQSLPASEMVRLIEEAGYCPVRRDTVYHRLDDN